MKKPAAFILLCLGLMLGSGCQTFNGTQFAPLEARLQSLDSAGAQTLVLVNTSGQTLHHVRFTASVSLQPQLVSSPQQPYVLLSNSGLPQRIQQAYNFRAFADQMTPGQYIHFRGRYTIGDFRILQPVTRVQIAGNCDEGAFRETWVMGDHGQFRLVGVPEN